MAMLIRAQLGCYYQDPELQWLKQDRKAFLTHMKSRQVVQCWYGVLHHLQQTNHGPSSTCSNILSTAPSHDPRQPVQHQPSWLHFSTQEERVKGIYILFPESGPYHFSLCLIHQNLVTSICKGNWKAQSLFWVVMCYIRRQNTC